MAANGLRYELQRIETSYQWYRANGQWNYEPVKRTRASPTARSTPTADKPARSVAAGELGPLPARSLDRRRQRRRHLAAPSTPASMPRPSADKPDLLEIALDKPGYAAGRDDECRGDRAHRRPPHPRRVHRPAGRDASQDVQDRHRECHAAGRRRLGHRRLCGRDVAPAARRAGARMPGRAIGVQWFSIDRAAHTLDVALNLPPTDAAELQADVPAADRRAESRRRGARRGRRGRCRHSQSDQLQAAGAGRLLSRPAPAHRRDPRPLRATDRRHAGRARTHPLGRRHRRRELSGSPPTQAPLALYSGIVKVGADGDGRCQFRYSGLHRHGAGDGGRLEQGQGRQGRRRRDRARSGRAHRDAAALPAHRRQRRRAARVRQCRGRRRRLQRDLSAARVR